MKDFTVKFTKNDKDEYEFNHSSDDFLSSRNLQIFGSWNFLCDGKNEINTYQDLYKIFNDQEEIERNLGKLDGAFSFVVIDADKKSIYAASDDFHQIPLYYSYHQNDLYFSTDLNKILMIGDNKLIDIEIVFDYLVSGIPRNGRTVYKHINIVPNDHCLKIYKTDEVKTRIVRSKKRNLNNLNYSDELKKLLKKNIKKRLLHFKEHIAMTLSGGLDSSALVGISKSLKNHNISTHSYLFRGLNEYQKKVSDEKQYIQSVVEMYNLDSNFHIFENDGPLKILDVTSNFNEPVSGTNIYTYHKMFKNLKEKNINILFEGIGGDDIIDHGRLRFYELGKQFKFRKLISEYKKFCDYENKEFRLINCIKVFIIKPYLSFFVKLIRKEKKENISYFSINHLLKDIHKVNTRHIFKNIHGYDYEHFDFIKYSMNEITKMKLDDGYDAYVNRAAINMASEYGINIVNPYYSQELKNFCQTVPLKEKMKDGKNRFYFREAIKEYVPKIVYQRTTKGDMSGMFLNELLEKNYAQIESLIFEDNAFTEKYFDKEKVKFFFENLLISKNQVHASMLYKIIYLAKWVKKRQKNIAI